MVGRPKGSIPGFAYSDGMKAKGGDWTYEDLNTFITKPSAYVSGTKMTYPGEPDEQKRADIEAYLQKDSDSRSRSRPPRRAREGGCAREPAPRSRGAGEEMSRRRVAAGLTRESLPSATVGTISEVSTTTTPAFSTAAAIGCRDIWLAATAAASCDAA